MTKTMTAYKNDAFITILQHDNGSHTVTLDTKLPNDYSYMVKLEFDAYSPNSKNLDMFMDLVKGTQEQVDLERMGRKPTITNPMYAPGPLIRDSDYASANFVYANPIPLAPPKDVGQTTVRLEFVSQTVSGSAIGVMSSYKFRDMLAYVEPLGGASTDE